MSRPPVNEQPAGGKGFGNLFMPTKPTLVSSTDDIGVGVPKMATPPSVPPLRSVNAPIPEGNYLPKYVRPYCINDQNFLNGNIALGNAYNSGALGFEFAYSGTGFLLTRITGLTEIYYSFNDENNGNWMQINPAPGGSAGCSFWVNGIPYEKLRLCGFSGSRFNLMMFNGPNVMFGGL